MSGRTGADAAVGAIRAAGVDVAFGLPGAHNIALWPAAARAGLRIVGARHEQGTAYAADGWSRVTGRAGVALVTTGPGAANTVAAVGEAWASHSPVVIVATDIPTGVRRPGTYRGWLHECTDQAALFSPITKATFTAATAGQIGPTLAAALAHAVAPPSGPVYVQLPTDLLGEPVESDGPAVAPPAPRPRPDLVGSWDGALAALAAAQRPVLWCGRGARDGRAAVQALAERLQAPVVSTFGARGVLERHHPLAIDVPPHEPEVTALLADADLVVVLGSDLDAMTTQGWRLPLPAPRIAVNVDGADAAKAYAMDHVLVGDVADVAGELARAVAPREGPWAPGGDTVRAGVLADVAATPATAAAARFLASTAAALPADTVVAADMAVAGYWLAGYHPVASPRSLLYPMGWGTLGFAFAAAVGAAVGSGGRPVVSWCGDGGMLFALGELATVAQEGLRLVAVVVDDGAYGMLRHGAPRGQDDATLGITLGGTDFAAVARGFGLPATTVDGVGDDYRQALARAVASDGPSLLHVHAALAPPPTTSPRWPLRDAPPAR